MRVTHIIETHVQADHLSGARRLAATARAPVLFHESAGVHFPHVDVADGEEHEMGNVRMTFLHTPGHTPDSLSILVTDRTRGPDPWFVLTGDTLFAGGVGRPDLSGHGAERALAEQLYDSVYTKLLKLPDHLETPAVAPAPQQLSPERRGDILMARKMYREAAETYKKGSLDSAIIENKIGIAYHQMLQTDIARKYYERSMKIDPAYAEATNNLGTVYYSKKSYRRAIKLYHRALKLAPNSASIYSNLGTAFFARKNYKQAAESYQKALSLDPDVFEHRSSWGVMLQERSVEERAKFHYYLAKTYAKAGMNERALLYIRKALEEGFTERKKMMEDPEFVSLRKLPEFQELMAMEPRVL